MRWWLPLSLALLAACGPEKDDTGSLDADGDGYHADEDCDESDPAVSPGATERCDGQDNDCDGAIDEENADGSTLFYADVDGDGYGDSANTIFICDMPEGYVGAAYDCDDADADTHPGARESCDDEDDDCDGEIDEDAQDTLTWYRDADGDGYGDERETTEACAQPSGYVITPDDCDDGAVGIHPGAVEHCDGVDEDCDREVDEDPADAPLWYADADGDGFGDVAATVAACAQPSGYGTDTRDCDDTTATVHPGADEYCNEVDDDCDGDVDESGAIDAPTWYPDADADGYGDAAGGATACTQPPGHLADATDCDDVNPAVHPGATELCNGDDDDCDRTTDAAGLVSLDGASNHATIAQAVALAASGSTILVCDGTYLVNLTTSDDLTLVSQNGPGSTILDGDENGAVLFVEGGALTVSGFTLVHGTGATTASISAPIGGAVVVDSVDPVLIDDCAFVDNEATAGGALALTEGATVSVTDSTFYDNAASSVGGAIWAEEASLSLSGVVLASNEAAYSGGAIYMEGGTLDLEATTIQDNAAATGGGLALDAGSEATASADTLVTANIADSLGGGVALLMATSWSGGMFAGNSAGEDGGAIFASAHTSSPLILADFTCTGNRAATLGGCIHAMGEVTLTGATIDANEALWGGGLYLEGAILSIGTSSVTANTASHLGGGAYTSTGSSLSSAATDWGTGSDENDPDDVYLESADAPFTFGAGATFTCTDASGTCL